MEELTLKQKSASQTEQNMLDYFVTHDIKYVAEDALFINVASGEHYKGKAEIGAMLHYMYQVAFDARLVASSYIITEEKAQIEGLMKGKHIGEFAGIPATGKEVSVPICVTYDLQNGLIKEARIFSIMDNLMKQLGVHMGNSAVKTTYLVRDIFQLKFGQYREAKKLLDEAMEKNLMPVAQQSRVFTDFTGDAYRLIFEEGFDSLADYELSFSNSTNAEEWQLWYQRFKPLVESSHREILKQVM